MLVATSLRRQLLALSQSRHQHNGTSPGTNHQQSAALLEPERGPPQADVCRTGLFIQLRNKTGQFSPQMGHTSQESFSVFGACVP